MRSLAIAVTVLLGAVGASGAQTPSYPERLAMVESLGQRYPAYIAANGDVHREIGLWGGIAIQTEWQVATERDDVALWDLVNHSLTVTPHELAAAFESGASCADPLCQAWFDYFEVASPQPALPGLPHFLDLRWHVSQRALWTAHRASIDHALAEHADTLGGALFEVVREEAWFWGGWVETVELLALANQATFDAVILPISEATFPTCGPLDPTTSCSALTQQPIGRLAFTVNMITTGQISGPASDLPILP